MKSRWRTKNISYIAAFSAAAVAVGFLLAALPNVELVTATVFISGAVGGKSKGAMVGALADGEGHGQSSFSIHREKGRTIGIVPHGDRP